MFLDTLGIIIGFVTVVLLLSILVTAIVQTFANLTRRRHKSLALGVSETKIESEVRALVDRSNLKDENSKILAQQVISTLSNAQTDSRITWLEDKDVIKPLTDAGIPKEGIAVAQLVLDRARRIMEDKYIQWARGITVVAAVIIAAWFGASAPDLLERLQTDAEFRARAEAMGEKLASDAPDEYRPILEGAPGLRARTAFLKDHPKYTVQLGSLRYEALSVDDLVANFETAMDAEPERDAMAAEYRKLVEAELADQSERAQKAAQRSMDDLASLGIEPLKDLSFYYESDADKKGRHLRFDRIIGVLFMAVLLSFGAPFWYRVLRELVGLKDALRKKVPPPPTN